MSIAAQVWGSRKRLLTALGLALLLFAVVYAPPSALAVALHLQLASAVPFIILTTVLSAGGLIYWLSRGSPGGLSQFGFCLPARHYIGLSIVIGAPSAIVAALLLSRAHEMGPLAGLSLATWLAVLYFVISSALQEEIIFRGLLQTTLATRASSQSVPSPATAIAASLLVALLFGCIHLTVGRFTALAALALGIIAGELRRRSGSLVPAVICHALFNLGGVIWP